MRSPFYVKKSHFKRTHSMFAVARLKKEHRTIQIRSVIFVFGAQLIMSRRSAQEGYNLSTMMVGLPNTDEPQT